MSPDRFNDPEGGQFPSDASREVLHSALAGYVAVRDEGPVCEAIDRFAREARERALVAERMLIVFKRLLTETPEVRAIANERDRQLVRDRLVTLCITAYYRKE